MRTERSGARRIPPYRTKERSSTVVPANVLYALACLSLIAAACSQANAADPPRPRMKSSEFNDTVYAEFFEDGQTLQFCLPDSQDRKTITREKSKLIYRDGKGRSQEIVQNMIWYLYLNAQTGAQISVYDYENEGYPDVFSASGGAINIGCKNINNPQARIFQPHRGSKPAGLSHQRIAPYMQKMG